MHNKTYPLDTYHLEVPDAQQNLPNIIKTNKY